MPALLFLAATREFTGFHGISALLLAAGIISLGVWLLAFGFRWLQTRPDLPDAGPEISEIPANPESPGVVNFLVNNWRATPSGISATIVDLAARRILGLDLVGIDGTVVRLRDRPAKGALTGYEQQVYDLVAGRATGGSAPIEAIRLDENAAERWIKKFERAVIDEARDKGLARRRWERIDYLIVGIGLVFVLGFFALAFGAAHVGASDPGSSNSSNISAWDWLMGAGFAWFAAMGLITRSQAVTDTPKGKEVCARWMGMRDYFRHSQAFDGQPPASVAIWDRLLAYGVAVGAARDAAEGLPVIAEDPHTAWTRTGGAWRELRIEYPVRFGWGQWPVKVFFEGIVRTLFWGGIAYVLLPVVAVIGWGVLQDGIDGTTFEQRQITIIVAVFAVAATVMGIYLSARAFGGLVRLVRGARDLGHRKTVEGDVVKVHRGRFAVDDGKSPAVKAFFLPAQPRVTRGQRVRAVVSPHLGHLFSLSVLSEAPADPSVAAVSKPNAAPLNVSLDALAAATGLSLKPMAGEDSDNPGLPVEQFEDGNGNHITITRMPPAMARRPLLAAVSQLASRGGEDVPGVGDSAHWVRERALVLETGGTLWMVDIDFPLMPPQERLAVAKKVAGVVIAG